MLSLIVAVAKNNVIGKDNKLIWHLPEDLKTFKKIEMVLLFELWCDIMISDG